MAEPRKGRQTPTQQFVLPYDNTKVGVAIDLYNCSGRTAQPWQELLVYDILSMNDDGLWTHQKFGYSVPRRNGKVEMDIYSIIHRIEAIMVEHIIRRQMAKTEYINIT